MHRTLAVLAPSALAIAIGACGAPTQPTSPGANANANASLGTSATATALTTTASAATPTPTSAIEVDASAPPDAAIATPAADAGPREPQCREQEPQKFLVRSSYIGPWNASADERKKFTAAHQEAIRYRTEQYGYVAGFGKPEWNAHPPTFYVVDTIFMGLPVKMHKKVVPALKCVEEALKASCTAHPYTPKALAGIRYKNTFQGGEVTNHMYGIALDLDPGLNSCCGCVKPWNQDPRCTSKKTVWERMGMPECWVNVFEKYGFYWLGHDVLQDTMHFDYLGDPDKIMTPAP